MDRTIWFFLSSSLISLIFVPLNDDKKVGDANVSAWRSYVEKKCFSPLPRLRIGCYWWDGVGGCWNLSNFPHRALSALCPIFCLKSRHIIFAAIKSGINLGREKGNKSICHKSHFQSDGPTLSHQLRPWEKSLERLAAAMREHLLQFVFLKCSLDLKLTCHALKSCWKFSRDPISQKLLFMLFTVYWKTMPHNNSFFPADSCYT